MTRQESRKQPFNESLYLYDMNADELFDQAKVIMIDSSLGLTCPVPPDRGSQEESQPS